MPLLSSNRFLAANESRSLQDIMNKQIFGFNCYVYKNAEGYEVTEGVVRSKYPPTEMMVSFETNADNHEFFVSDFNNLVGSKA